MSVATGSRSSATTTIPISDDPADTVAKDTKEYPSSAETLGQAIVSSAKRLAGLRVAHEAVAVEDARDLLNRNRGVTYPEMDPQVLSGGHVEAQPLDDMHVGDTITNVYNTPPAAPEKSQPAPFTPQPPVIIPPNEESTFSKLAKALAGPLVGAGIAIAAMQLMKPDDASPAPDYVNTPELQIVAPEQ